MTGYRGKIRKRRIRKEWEALQAQKTQENQRRLEVKQFIGTDVMRRRIELVWRNLAELNHVNPPSPPTSAN